MYKTRITQSYIMMRCINLGVEFIRDHNLVVNQKYQVVINANPSAETKGTLHGSNALTGMSFLYRKIKLRPDDEVQLEYIDAKIIVTPIQSQGAIKSEARLIKQDSPEPDLTDEISANVFERQKLKHIHIEAFAERNFREWEPKTEADVYLVFGSISEYTDFKYCCGASQDLLTKLGYASNTKPDAILIDRATDEYLISEFKMNSKDFKSNHIKDDVDVLVCWIDDETDRSKLPNRILGLNKLIEESLKSGDIEI